MKHKHADLIKAYADDDSIRFVPTNGNMPYTLEAMLTGIRLSPEWDWQIYQPPVKWRKEMDAFARGEIVQFKTQGVGWRDLKVQSPTWECCAYRIKPKTETRWLWASKDGKYINTFYANLPSSLFTIKLLWSAAEFELENE